MTEVTTDDSSQPPLPEGAEKVAYHNLDKPDRGYAVRACYLKQPNDGDAVVEIFKDGAVLRSFKYPAYRIWNIAAHFRDIVDGELEKHDGGYRAADWNGLTPQGPPQPLPDPEPPEPDGECFRGGEAAAYDSERMAEIQRTLK